MEKGQEFESISNLPIAIHTNAVPAMLDFIKTRTV